MFDPIRYETLRQRAAALSARAERAQDEIVLMLAEAIAGGAIIYERFDSEEGSLYFVDADGSDEATEIPAALFDEFFGAIESSPVFDNDEPGSPRIGSEWRCVDSEMALLVEDLRERLQVSPPEESNPANPNTKERP